MLPDRRPPSRAELQRALAVNAATKPVNVAVGAGVAVAGIVLGAVWLIALAVVAYAALGLLTFFDGEEAERVGEKAYGRGKAKTGAARSTLDATKLATPIRRRVEKARQEQRGIAATLRESDLEWTDVDGEVTQLVGALEAAARRAQRLYGYLSTQDVPELERRITDSSGDAREALRVQRRTLLDLHRRLDSVVAEMDAVIASLGTVHARLVGASVARDGATEADLLGTVRELRGRVNAAADGLEAAYPAPPGS